MIWIQPSQRSKKPFSIISGITQPYESAASMVIITKCYEYNIS